MRLAPRTSYLYLSFLLALEVCLTSSSAQGDPSDNLPPYRSPQPIVLSPDGQSFYVGDVTAKCVAVFDTESGDKYSEIPLRGQPQDLGVSLDGCWLFATERGAGTVAIIDLSRGAVSGRVAVGRWPSALALAEKTQRLFVCNQDRHTVSVIDMLPAGGKPLLELVVEREPNSIALTPDEQYAVVSNLLPHGVATDPQLAAAVSIIDTNELRTMSHVRLPAGSTLVRGVCTSPDGKWAYVVHNLGRFHLPITQLDHGWVNTSALSIIDIAKGCRLATVLLDELHHGAPNAYSIVCSGDGRQLWISHAAVHEVSVVQIGLVHRLLEGKLPTELAALKSGSQLNIWARIKKDRSAISELPNELTALRIAEAIRRFPSGGLGPRHLALSHDERELLVTNYYSGTASILNATSGRLQRDISLGEQPPPGAARRGELIFHDATRAFQRWQSCSSCHPNQGRVDGLRWDFLRDGIGNGKDTPSLLLVGETEPLNRRATRANLLVGARTGFTAGHFMVPAQSEVDDLVAYLGSLRPEMSPHCDANGNLSSAAQRGKTLFSGKAACASCHPPPMFTDKKLHHIGVISDTDSDGRYDTPTLIEGYRTAPYLHDGRALTLKAVFTDHDPHGLHGKTKTLSNQELDDLVAYLQSL